MASSHSKTEKASQRRVEKARKEGNVASSRELVAAFQFLVFVTVAMLWFPAWLRSMREMLRASLAAAFSAHLDPVNLPAIVGTLLDRAFSPVFYIGGITVAAVLGLHLASTRFGFSLQKLTPDFKRLNPIKKIQNMASQGPAAVLEAAAMLVIFAAAIASIIRENAELFLSLPFASLEAGLSKVGGSLKGILWKAVAIFLVFGIIDLVRQRSRLMKELRMTKQEVKEEHKESEGNPLVRGKIRRLQRDRARRRMMQEVATATAVIVNPTHYAVALRYDHNTMATPMVVAKGKNYLALRIRQRAVDAGVPLVENPPLAQALYKSVDVGKAIPPHLYRAIAEVLAYVYRLTGLRK